MYKHVLIIAYALFSWSLVGGVTWGKQFRSCFVFHKMLDFGSNDAAGFINYVFECVVDSNSTK